MKVINCVLYNNYLKNRKIENGTLLVGKTKKSYLIGPIINSNFDEYSFYKRMISTSIYNTKIYKKMFKRTAIKLANQYFTDLKNNEVIEILKDGKIVIHKIISLPRGKYEKE